MNAFAILALQAALATLAPASNDTATNAPAAPLVEAAAPAASFDWQAPLGDLHKQADSTLGRYCYYDYVWYCDGWGNCRYAYRWICI